MRRSTLLLLVALLLASLSASQAQHAINVLSYDYALSFYANGPSTTTGGTLLSVQTTIENCWNAILAKTGPAAPYVSTGYQDYMFALQVTNCYFTTNGATQYTTTFLGGLGNAQEWAPFQPPGASTSIWYHVTNLTSYAVQQATTPLPILGSSTFYGYECFLCTALNSSGLQDLFYEASTINAASYLAQVLLGKFSQLIQFVGFGAVGNTITNYSPTSGTQTAILFPVGACPATSISIVPCSGAGASNPTLSIMPASSPYTAQSIALYRPLCTPIYTVWSPNTTQACMFDPCTYLFQHNNASACANGGTCVNNFTANASPVFSCTCTGNFNPANNCTGCTTGWVNPSCNTWNPCSVINPCLNGATCVNNATSGGFPQSTCTCAPGWIGSTCAVWAPCTYNNTCLNGGTCVANATQGGSPIETCTCAQGYVGTTCQTWNPCAFNNTCLNGGTCNNNATQNGIPQQTCACAQGYVGSTCQTWNPCAFNNTCLNGGTCNNNATQNGIPQQTCTCAPGYTGTTCQTWDPCTFNNTCLNDGTCVNNATQNGIPQQTCTCAQGYIGTTCQTWNPCAFNNTCLNGATCVNNVTQNGSPQKTCTCAPGYIGLNCQTWAPCSYNNTCLNGGTCVANSTVGGFPIETCTCAPGYVGTTCQTWNPCAFNGTYCLNGATCNNNVTQNGVPQQTCTCAPGYVGTNCQTWAPCSYNNTCLNGGTCVANLTVGGLPIETCVCAQGYIGSTCQTWNPCAFNNTCLNGATCNNNATQNGVPQQTCTCATGYIGTTCQTWNPCAFNNTCLNGGTCVNNATQNGTPQQTCTCATGYVGTTCQTWNPCAFNNPCQHGSTCVNNATQNGSPQSTCACTPGYLGNQCQTWDPCTYYNQPCMNGGSCSNNATIGGFPQFQCSCSIGYTRQNCSVWDPCNAIPNACPTTAVGCTDSVGPVSGQANYTCVYSSTTLANQGYRYAVMSDEIGPSTSHGAVLIGNAVNIIQCVNMILSTPGIPFIQGFQDAYFYFNLYANPAQCFYLNSTTQLASFNAAVETAASWQQLINLQSESWFHIANLTAYASVSASLPYLQGQPQFDPVECLVCPLVQTTNEALYLASSINAANYLIQTLGGFPDIAYGFFSSGSVPNSFFEFFPNSPNQTVVMHTESSCPGGLVVVPCSSAITSPVAASFGIPAYNALLYRPTCTGALQLWDPMSLGTGGGYDYCDFEPCKYYTQHNATSCFHNGTCTDNPYALTVYGGGHLPPFNCSCPLNFTASSNCTACSAGFVGSDCHWDPCTYYNPCLAGSSCMNAAFPLAPSTPAFTCLCKGGYVGTNCSTWNPCLSFPNTCPMGGVCSNQPGPDPNLNYTCAYDSINFVVNSYDFGISIDEFGLENYLSSGVTFIGPAVTLEACINAVLARGSQLPFMSGLQDVFVFYQEYASNTDCSYISSQTVYNELASTVSSPGAWSEVIGQGSNAIWFHVANLTSYALSGTPFLPNIECLYCPGGIVLNQEYVYLSNTLAAANRYVQLLASVPQVFGSFFSFQSVPVKFGPPASNGTTWIFSASDCPAGLQVVQCGPNQPKSAIPATLASFATTANLYRPQCNSSAYQVWLPEQGTGGCAYDPCTYFTQRNYQTCLHGGTCVSVPVSSTHPVGIHCNCPTGYDHAHNCSICSPGFTGPTCQWDPCTYYANSTCFNGGTCVANATVDGVQPYTCTCATGYSGPTCSQWTPCASNNCTGGSVCTANSTVGGSPQYSCACLPGYGGPNCAIWNPCLYTTMPCNGNGVCTVNGTVGILPGFMCNCTTGFAGSNCTSCSPGYIGASCVWDPCDYLGNSTVLCGVNGVCSGAPPPTLNYTCGCTPGYTGSGCMTWNPCLYYNQPCQNGGMCFNDNTVGEQPGYVCQCTNGFSGQNCTTGTTTSTTTTTTPTTSTTTTTANTTATTTLSTGAIAGIAVGAVVGTGLVVAGAVAAVGAVSAAGGAGGASAAAASAAAVGVFGEPVAYTPMRMSTSGKGVYSAQRESVVSSRQPKWKQKSTRR